MFLPENIDFAFSEKYNLSIRLTPSGFSFIITEPQDSSVFFLQEIPLGKRLSYIDNIKKLIFDYTFFSNSFHKVNIICADTEFTLIPDRFFERKSAVEYYKFNIHKLQPMHVLDQSVADYNMHILFGMNEDLYNFLARNLVNPVFTHSIGYHLNFYKKKVLKPSTKTCYIDIDNDLLTIICKDKDILLSANQLKIIRSMDCLYYFAGIWEKLEFNQLHDVLYLTPNCNKYPDIMDSIRQLIKNVHIIDIKTKVEMNSENEIPTEFKLSLCE